MCKDMKNIQYLYIKKYGMSLDLHFYKKGINIQEIRENISNLYEKKQAIEEPIEQLEDAYEDAKLASINITMR